MTNTYRDSKGNVMALVIPAEHSVEGIEFFTRDEDPQQVAFMGHPAGHEIQRHYHNPNPRTIDYTCETLVMRKGIMQVDLYENREILHSFLMKAGDIVTLFSGGHGFKMIEDTEMVEIKQGPYPGPADKTRF